MGLANICLLNFIPYISPFNASEEYLVLSVSVYWFSFPGTLSCAVQKPSVTATNFGHAKHPGELLLFEVVNKITRWHPNHLIRTIFRVGAVILQALSAIYLLTWHSLNPTWSINGSCSTNFVICSDHHFSNLNGIAPPPLMQTHAHNPQ